MALKRGIDLTNESIQTIIKFRSGEIQPIKTGVPHLDEALLGGLLPSSVLGIVARSAHGKTYDMERIQSNIMDHYPDTIILNCAWEMEHFKLLVRDVSKQTGRSFKDVLFSPIDAEFNAKFKEIVKKHKAENIYYQNEPVNSKDFAIDVKSLIEKFPDKKIVVFIDNLENILVEGDQKSSMDKLLYEVNRLKKSHPYIAFVILNQLNRDYMSRIDNPKMHRPMDSDIYGSDQLLKLCDVLYIKMLPWKLGIREKYMVFGDYQYSWLDEHKVDNGNKFSFDPYGKAFYFYLKLRQPENEKDIRDLHIETMFTREETGYKGESNTKKVAEPKFPETPIMLPQNFNANTDSMQRARGGEFGGIPSFDDEKDAPF